MELIKKSNKATIIAAALLMTVAVSIFGVSANEDTATNNNTRPLIREDCPALQELTDEQKEALKEAQELMDKAHELMEEARGILDEAGIKSPMMNGRYRNGQQPFSNNLTDEQKEALKEAHELLRAGDEEGAQAILDAAGFPEKPFRKGPRSNKSEE